MTPKSGECTKNDQILVRLSHTKAEFKESLTNLKSSLFQHIPILTINHLQILRHPVRSLDITRISHYIHL